MEKRIYQEYFYTNRIENAVKFNVLISTTLSKIIVNSFRLVCWYRVLKIEMHAIYL